MHEMRKLINLMESNGSVNQQATATTQEMIMVARVLQSFVKAQMTIDDFDEIVGYTDEASVTDSIEALQGIEKIKNALNNGKKMTYFELIDAMSLGATDARESIRDHFEILYPGVMDKLLNVVRK